LQQSPRVPLDLEALHAKAPPCSGAFLYSVSSTVEEC